MLTMTSCKEVHPLKVLYGILLMDAGRVTDCREVQSENKPPSKICTPSGRLTEVKAEVSLKELDSEITFKEEGREIVVKLLQLLTMELETISSTPSSKVRVFKEEQP